MDKISIIIPAYNVEPYIKKCLDSVIGQTHTNLEILLVNDGSTDKSGKICDECAGKDSRIRVFHKDNGGLSSALNVGLENFTGDYLGFVDSDDWIEPDMFEVLYLTAKTHDVPISVVNYFKDAGSQSTPMINKLRVPDGIISTRDMLLYPLKRDYYMGFCSYVWNKLYKADVIKASGLMFENNIKYGMDVVFYMSLVLSCRCVGAYTNKPLYHYLQRSSAISKSKSYNIKFDILTVYKIVAELFSSNGYSDISFWARGFYCYHASVIAEIAIANDDMVTLRLMQAEIKEHLDDYKKTNEEFPDKLGRIYKLLDVQARYLQ